MMDYLVVIGTNSIDEYYEMDCLPVMGEKVICKPISTEVGGMLGNAASVLGGYGKKTYMIDFLNKGKYLSTILKSMEDNNVDYSYFSYDETIPDSICQVMLKDGERIIFVIPNNKENLILSQKQLDLIKGSSCTYTTLTELRSFENLQDLMSLINSSNTKLALDIEPSTLKSKEEDWSIISNSFVIFVNEGGDGRFRELFGESYIKDLNLKGCTVVRTCGKDGCEVHSQSNEKIKIPGYKVLVVDTTGAGDTFNSSFVYGMLNNWDLEKCATFANAAAAKSVELFGPRSGISKESEVWEFIKSKSEGRN